MNMNVYIVSYFYSDGTYAGIIGVYDSESKADSAIFTNQLSYSDCTFVITSATIE